MNIARLKGVAIMAAIAAAATISATAQETHHDGGSSGHQIAADLSPEALAFRAENDAAMKRMMAAMHIAPTGDIDRDFVAMMIPHHQSAIAMALAVLRSSRNEAVRRLAQEIIITQQDEIRAMRLAIGDNAIPSASPAGGTTTEQDR